MQDVKMWQHMLKAASNTKQMINESTRLSLTTFQSLRVAAKFIRARFVTNLPLAAFDQLRRAVSCVFKSATSSLMWDCEIWECESASKNVMRISPPLLPRALKKCLKLRDMYCMHVHVQAFVRERHSAQRERLITAHMHDNERSRDRIADQADSVSAHMQYRMY